MAKSWINPNDRTQEEWARKYLLKKQLYMTSSIEGSDASKAWQGNSALEFLRSLEARSWDEAAIILLKKMKAAWTQQIRKNHSSKTIQVHISLSHSKQLNSLAKAAGITRGIAMEMLISNNYEGLMRSITMEKDTNRRNREMITHLQLENEKLRKQLSDAQKELSQSTGGNRSVDR